MAIRLAMGFGPAPEMISFHSAGKPLTFGYADYVYLVTLLEQAGIQCLANLERRGSLCPDLHEVLQLFPGSLQMALLWRVEPLGLAKAQLNGMVAVFLLSLDLRHKTRPGGHSRNCLQPAILVKYLGHPQLSTYDTFGFNHDQNLTILSLPTV
jgi:hypothetical protein